MYFTTPPSVSIIMATSGRAAALRETLDSLSSVAIPRGWIVEFLLVENFSYGNGASLLEAFSERFSGGCSYYFEPLRGKSNALNLALTYAKGELLLFSDDDVRFPKNWIEGMCTPILTGSTDAVAGGVSLAPNLLRPWMGRTHRAWLASTADYLERDAPSEMCGANMALRRCVLEQVGGFDTELGPGITGGGEESLLSWQLIKVGFTIKDAFTIIVEHHPDSSRLQYANWIRAAENKGAAQAYLLHHWFHRRIRFPRIKRFWVRTKLVLRRLITARRRPGDEGISPWELSYVADCSMYERYQRERLRARHYSPTEIRKLDSDRLSGAA